MVYEMRFQTVDPARRAEYVKIYRVAVQGCKAAGSTGVTRLELHADAFFPVGVTGPGDAAGDLERAQAAGRRDDDPSAVIVILLWESKEHLARWRDTPSYKLFRAAVEGFQTKKSHGGFYLAETI